jgi:hypothetical protein
MFIENVIIPYLAGFFQTYTLGTLLASGNPGARAREEVAKGPAIWR